MGWRCRMPLNEDEQRILREIEEHLQRDQTFVREIRPGGRTARRRVLGWCAATVAMFALVLVTMTIHPLLGFGCFVGAVACALVAETTVREVNGRPWQGIAESWRSRSPGSRDRATDQAD